MQLIKLHSMYRFKLLFLCSDLDCFLCTDLSCFLCTDQRICSLLMTPSSLVPMGIFLISSSLRSDTLP